MLTKCPYGLCVLGLTLLPVLPSFAKPPIVAIDAGHSIAHSGATSASGKPEFDFNAALATIFSNFLAAQGVQVIKIGHDGMMADLLQRPQLANAAGADFFLSVHHDSAQPRYFRPWQWEGKTLQHTDHAAGFSLFVSRKNPHVAESLRCASALGKSLRQAGFSPSQHHAEAIEGENKPWADQINGVFYYDNLVVLKATVMPAVLLEAAVIANRQDEDNITKPQVRQQMAVAVAKGLSACGVLPPSHYETGTE
jgi:N-acetylmuramoyl-L-alanine amidase